MKAKEFFEQHLPNHRELWNFDDLQKNSIFNLMEEYAALRIHDVVGRSEQLVCPNCDGEGFNGKGTNEILPCLRCFGSGERAD